MNGELRKIKRKYGEDMAKLCRSLFPTILENPGLLYDLLITHFATSRCLYDDIIDSGSVNSFRGYIYSLAGIDDDPIRDYNGDIKTPTELLDEAGYVLYECKTLDELNEFKKFYAKEEELCTFKDGQGRLDRCFVFFAVKKDVDKIKREDFDEPQREDLYGTSVISIQFTRNKYHAVSIKSRYNHSVWNPDACFSNNLDSIINGLTVAFANTYGLLQCFDSDNFKIPGYRQVEGMFYKCNSYSLNNIYYCPNNVIIDDGHVIKDDFPPEQYIIMDYFIVDLKTGKVSLYDNRIKDSFVDSMKDVTGVNIEKKGGNRILHFSTESEEDIDVVIDKANRIIGVVNNDVKEIGDNFLCDCRKVKYVEMDNVLKIGNRFLQSDEVMKDISISKVENIGDDFLYSDFSLEKVDFPKLQSLGNNCIYSTSRIKRFDAPNLEKVGRRFAFSSCRDDYGDSRFNVPKLNMVQSILESFNLGLAGRRR